ncbi:MAG TPA: BrnT family toxin [Acidobacteriaceae bacterium]|nr:BrnT family toxin [Acidobacteriaceae bacterium]
MEVTYSASKNAENIRKHGISLARAKDFDMGPSANIYYDDSQDYGELRYHAVGWLDAKMYSFIFTFTDGVYRAISLRDASPQERKSYAEEN